MAVYINKYKLYDKCFIRMNKIYFYCVFVCLPIINEFLRYKICFHSLNYVIFCVMKKDVIFGIKAKVGIDEHNLPSFWLALQVDIIIFRL